MSEDITQDEMTFSNARNMAQNQKTSPKLISCTSIRHFLFCDCQTAREGPIAAQEMNSNFTQHIIDIIYRVYT
jgi:hypothetical protein